MINWIDYRNAENYSGKTRWYLDTVAGIWIIEEKNRGVFHAILLDNYEEELENLGPFDCQFQAINTANKLVISRLRLVVEKGKLAENQLAEMVK